jgi:hypothetical protein
MVLLARLGRGGSGVTVSPNDVVGVRGGSTRFGACRSDQHDQSRSDAASSRTTNPAMRAAATTLVRKVLVMSVLFSSRGGRASREKALGWL